MKKIKISYFKDVDLDLIKFLKKKGYRCTKNKNFKNIRGFLDNDIFITKYKDIPSFSQKKFNLKVLQLTTSDYSKINLKKAKEKNIIVINNMGANSTSVAEHTIGLLLSCFRNIIIQNNLLKKGIWKNLKNKNIELEKKKIGIIGIGNIGSKVAKLAKAFGMKIYFNDIEKKKIIKFQKIYNYSSKTSIYKNCDIISLHVNLNKTTYKLIKRKNLNLMRKNGVIINTSRGKVVDEKDLYFFLKKNKSFKACLDVFENENKINKKLVKLKNVISTPHSGPSFETREKLFQNILNIIKNVELNKISDLKKNSLNFKI